MRMMEKKKGGRERKTTGIRSGGNGNTQREGGREEEEMGCCDDAFLSWPKGKKRKTVANGYEDSIWRDNLTPAPPLAVACRSKEGRARRRRLRRKGADSRLSFFSRCPNFKTVER